MLAISTITLGVLAALLWRRAPRSTPPVASSEGALPSFHDPTEDGGEITRVSDLAERPFQDEVCVVSPALSADWTDGRPLRTLVSAAAQSRRGEGRKKNDDAVLAAEDVGIFAIADGVGGRQAGGQASRTALDLVLSALAASEEPELRDVEISGAAGLRLPRDARALLAAMFRANGTFWADRDASRHGMSTTLTAIRFSSTAQVVYVAHVGDSRCYRVRRGKAAALSADHARAGELTRALGLAPKVRIDLRIEPVEIGDVFVLCSDGLSSALGPELIGSTAQDRAPKRAARELTHAASLRGVGDDASVVVVQVTGVTLPSVRSLFRVLW